MRFGINKLNVAIVLLRIVFLCFPAANTIAAEGVLGPLSPPYECNISGSPDLFLMAACNSGGSGNGNSTALSAVASSNDGTCTLFCGVRSDSSPLPASSVAPIMAYNVCRWVDNNSGQSIFVPFRTQSEWQQFLANKPPQVTATTCAVPYAVSGAASSSMVTPYPDCNTTTVNNPNVYGRSGTSTWPATPPNPWFICGATSVTSRLQWIAGVAPDTGPTGQLSWISNFLFSPNMVFTATDVTTGGSPNTSITIAPGDTVDLNLAVTPQANDSFTLAGWSGAVTGGELTVNPTVTTTYTVTSTDTANGLTSTAAVTVVVGASPATCGSDGNQTLAEAPTNLCQPGENPSAVTPNTGGWTWTCTRIIGNETISCSASLQAAQCGMPTINNDNTITGALCTYGTASTTPTAANPAYSCTTGSGVATSTADCTAQVAAKTTGVCHCWISELSGLADYTMAMVVIVELQQFVPSPTMSYAACSYWDSVAYTQGNLPENFGCDWGNPCPSNNATTTYDANCKPTCRPGFGFDPLDSLTCQ
jgi:hypothetical protein